MSTYLSFAASRPATAGRSGTPPNGHKGTTGGRKKQARGMVSSPSRQQWPKTGQSLARRGPRPTGGTDGGPRPEATPNSGPRHCNWHCGWRLPGLVPTAKEKKHDDMWVYSANCNVYLYIYIAVGTNPRVVIDCKWHKAHCSVMPCHAVPSAADECASPTAGALAGASRVKASVHPTAFRPEATAPPVRVFFTNPRGFSYGCNNSHCYCRRHLFSSTHGKIGCRSHGKTLFNITTH